MNIAEINNVLRYQKVILPTAILQWVDLPDRYTLGITCRDGCILMRHNMGIFLDATYILLIDAKKYHVISYGQFVRGQALLEAPVLKREYSLVILKSSHPHAKLVAV